MPVREKGTLTFTPPKLAPDATNLQRPSPCTTPDPEGHKVSWRVPMRHIVCKGLLSAWAALFSSTSDDRMLISGPRIVSVVSTGCALQQQPGSRWQLQKNRPPSLTGARLPWFSRVESFFGGRTAWGPSERMCLGGGAAALRPFRATRSFSTLGWCRCLGRQTVFHQPNVHAADTHGLFVLIALAVCVA